MKREKKQEREAKAKLAAKEAKEAVETAELRRALDEPPEPAAAAAKEAPAVDGKKKKETFKEKMARQKEEKKTRREKEKADRETENPDPFGTRRGERTDERADTKRSPRGKRARRALTFGGDSPPPQLLELSLGADARVSIDLHFDRLPASLFGSPTPADDDAPARSVTPPRRRPRRPTRRRSPRLRRRRPPSASSTGAPDRAASLRHARSHASRPPTTRPQLT